MRRYEPGMPRWMAITVLTVPVVLFVGLVGWLKAECNEIDRDYAVRQAKEAEVEAMKRADQQLTEKERAAELERQRQAKTAKDREEHVLGAADRTVRILGALPDVCEAKRLLAKAPDPKAVSLQKARAAIATEEAKQLAAERKDFGATRSVVCVDGWSSTCLCSHIGSGCCSNHQGVAGCEPYPKEIACSSAD